MPTTPALRAIYHDPMEEWFQNLEIEIEAGEMYKPYDPTVPDQVAGGLKARVTQFQVARACIRFRLVGLRMCLNVC